MPFTADIVAEGADIFAFEETWERLYQSGPNEPSTSFEWTAALLRNHLSPGDRAFLLRLSHGTDVIALVPLVVSTTRVLGCAVTMMTPLSERYGTHSDVLAGSLDDDAVRALVRGLFGLGIPWDVFRLSSLLEHHALARDVGVVLQRPLSWQLRDGHPSYMLELPASLGAYLGQRSAKFRNHLRRVERKVESGGDAQVVEVQSPTEVGRGFEMLMDVERASWKHGHGTAISAVAHQADFYRDLCRGAAARGRLHLQFLLLAGRPVAYNLGYLRDGTYAYLKTSYRDSHRQAGVATYLRARLMETLIARDVRVVDFPAEPYEWERQWTDTVRWHRVLSLYRPTPVGLALAVADRVRHRSLDGRTITHVDPRALKPTRSHE